MRILQVNKLYYPWIGGVEKIVKVLAEGLKDRLNIDILVCKGRGLSSRERVFGINVVRASSLGLFLSMPISFDFPVHFFMMAKRADVIHFHVPFPLAELCFLLLGAKKKAICSWHSEIVRQRFFLKWYRKLLKRFLDSVKVIVVAMPQLIHSSDLLKNFEGKCVIIPFGIDLKSFEMNSGVKSRISEIRRKFGQRIVLSVGRMVYYKGFKYLIEAMKGVDANLVIIGEGPLKRSLMDYAENLGLQKRVFFLDHVSDQDLVAFYHSSLIFVLPSIEKTEAFGLVQLEAMACGKPVINTSLDTAVPHVSIHNHTGLTVPPKDSSRLREAIVYLLENEEKRMEFGENARKRVMKNFSLDAMLRSYLEVYERVYDSSP